MIHIGIDPGAAGAVAVLRGSVLLVFDTPFVKPAKGRGDYDSASMADLLRPYAGRGMDVHVVLESVHSMPGQGVSSTFAFGCGFGIWKGILGYARLPYTLVSPQRWKKEMLADMRQDKDFSRIRAQQVFPGEAALFARKKDDGRAEAALMAAYSQRKVEGP